MTTPTHLRIVASPAPRGGYAWQCTLCPNKPSRIGGPTADDARRAFAVAHVQTTGHQRALRLLAADLAEETAP